jgi:mono/diheme cytochrome c family protein
MATHEESTSDSGPINGEGELYGVLAEFDTPGELVEAAKRVRDAGYTEFDCYTPFPVHGIDEAMGIKRTILPLLIFGGGFAGTVGGLFLQWWCNAYNWPWNISGKPAWSIPANVPIGFETTILAAVLTAFFGMWILNKLPQVWHPFFRLERFGRVTDDAFLLGIEAKDERFDREKTTKLLQDAGAIAVEDCFLEADPARRTMPKWITAMIVSSTAFALIPFAIAAKARNSYSTEPHIHIFPDMDFQPKYKSDTADDLFPDGRANRGELPGTIARDSLNADDLFYRGTEQTTDRVRYAKECADQPADKPCNIWTRGFPKQLEINEALMKRGQQRFNIYCSPCHGYDGHGKGMIFKRTEQLGTAWSQIRDLTAGTSIAIQMPNGQLFNTISNGMNTMMGYASQIQHTDRWAIVLYVRALQRSQNAAIGDVPPEELPRMQQPAIQQPPAPTPGSGSATEPGK